jgi:ketosteroid isomerase-like protein
VSGIETYSSITGVFTVREGQISRVEFYFDHDRALAAAGLED